MNNAIHTINQCRTVLFTWKAGMARESNDKHNHIKLYRVILATGGHITHNSSYDRPLTV